MRSNQLESPSYMELRLDIDEKESSLFLRVPTFWDDVNKQWIGALKLPGGKILKAVGKTSFDLQNSFNREASKIFKDEKYGDELFSLFKPLEYWEEQKDD